MEGFSPVTCCVKLKQHFIKRTWWWQCWIIEGTINSALYLKIPSDRQFMFSQQDNGPKHTSKATSEMFKKVWPSQSQDLNQIEMRGPKFLLFDDLKRIAVTNMQKKNEEMRKRANSFSLH